MAQLSALTSLHLDSAPQLRLQVCTVQEEREEGDGDAGELLPALQRLVCPVKDGALLHALRWHPRLRALHLQLPGAGGAADRERMWGRGLLLDLPALHLQLPSACGADCEQAWGGGLLLDLPALQEVGLPDVPPCQLDCALTQVGPCSGLTEVSITCSAAEEERPRRSKKARLAGQQAAEDAAAAAGPILQSLAALAASRCAATLQHFSLEGLPRRGCSLL